MLCLVLWSSALTVGFLRMFLQPKSCEMATDLAPHWDAFMQVAAHCKGHSFPTLLCIEFATCSAVFWTWRVQALLAAVPGTCGSQCLESCSRNISDLLFWERPMHDSGSYVQGAGQVLRRLGATGTDCTATLRSGLVLGRLTGTRAAKCNVRHGSSFLGNPKPTVGFL